MFEESFGECGGGFCAASLEQIAVTFGKDVEPEPFIQSRRSSMSTFAKFSRADVDAVLSDCGTQIFDFAVTLKPRTVPLFIPLSPALTDPVGLACAQAIAEHLSGKCGRAVGVSELAGLVLYLWSEDDPDGRALDKYLGERSRPLQAVLLEMRTLEGRVENLVSAELVPFVGQRFEILTNR